MIVILLACVSILLAGCVVVAWRWRPETVARSLVRRRCLLTMKDGESFSGVLWQVDRSMLVLRDAASHRPGGEVPVDGLVVVFRADVAYVQMP